MRAMQQPFAHRPVVAAAAPSSSSATGGRSGWAEKKGGTGRCFVVSSAASVEWFGSDTKKDRLGTLRTDSVMSVELEGATVTLGTATKTHAFVFESDAEAVAWRDHWKPLTQH